MVFLSKTLIFNTEKKIFIFYLMVSQCFMKTVLGNKYPRPGGNE